MTRQSREEVNRKRRAFMAMYRALTPEELSARKAARRRFENAMARLKQGGTGKTEARRKQYES